MKIIKFCKKEHNINISENIQLGSFKYYNEHKNELIRDSTDGAGTIKIEYERPRAHSQKDRDILGMNVKGPYNLVCKKLSMENKNPNVYIFCTSIIEDDKTNILEIGKQFGPDYDSFYEIKDLRGFLNEIIKLLQTKLNLNNVFSIMNQIVYIDEKCKHFIDFKEIKKYKKNIPQQIIDQIFTKLKESKDVPGNFFENNKEYRFAWIINDSEGKPFENLEDTIFIPSQTLRKFTE